MASKKNKSRHSADPADSRSAKMAKTPNPNPNPSPNLNLRSRKSSENEPSPSTDSMAKDSNPSSQRKLQVQDSNNEDNALTILNGVTDFRMKNSANLTPSLMKRFHDDLRGSLHFEITEDKLYNKLRVLRRKFCKIASSGAGPCDDDHAFYELSLKAWEIAGEKQKKKTEASGEISKEHDEEEDQKMEDSEGDAAINDGLLKYFIYEMREYWKAKKLQESELGLGLKTVDIAKAKALDKKLRDCMEVEMKPQVKRHSLRREFVVALVAASRGL